MLERQPDVTVLMPTYNDEKYISTSIESLQNQNFKNWELIVIDNGSGDTTPDIVKYFAQNDDRIKYLFEQNSGQLNALLFGSKFAKGKYITFLHSDDALLDAAAFERNIAASIGNEYDGVYGDLYLMNANGRIQGRSTTLNSLDVFSPAILFLRAGTNPIPDLFFVTKEAFNNVLSSYITWNMPYWLKLQTNTDFLKLKKVDPWYKYRTYFGNYIHSEVGRFETVNGCLRTVLEIGRRLDFPLLRLQRQLARTLKTRAKPLFKHNPSSPQHIRDMVIYTLNYWLKRVPNNIYFRGLIGFYSNFPSTRTIELEFVEGENIFLGKDARLFFNLMQRNSLPRTYEYVLEEASKGFRKATVKNGKNHERAKHLMRFLNLACEIAVG